MKRKIKMWLVLFFSLIITSCTVNEDEYRADNEEQVVTIRIIGSPMNTSTRAEEESVTGSAAFKSGYLFFVTGNNRALKQCYRITPEKGTATSLKDFVINVKDFWNAANTESGYSFTNVPGDVTSVYILGNVPENGSTSEENIRKITTLNKLKEIVIPVTAQNDIATITMDGIGNVTNVLETANLKKVANIELTPFSSRVEIASITGGGDITSFKISGIYISHFYENVKLNQDAVNELFKYTSNNEEENYTEDKKYAMMADIASPGTSLGGNKFKKQPENNKVWGYQFIPDKQGESIRIVIKLTDIQGSTSYQSPQYLNIRGFYSNSDDPTLPIKLKRGKIYNLGESITFDESNLSPIPNPDDIDLTIKVSVKEWDVVHVNPII